MSIIEQIDNAVQDWETSPDAMRWTPEKPEQPASAPAKQARVALRLDVESIVDALRRAGPAIQEMADAWNGVVAELRMASRRVGWITVRPRRDPRISAMRRAYRRRRGGRW